MTAPYHRAGDPAWTAAAPVLAAQAEAAIAAVWSSLPASDRTFHTRIGLPPGGPGEPVSRTV